MVPQWYKGDSGNNRYNFDISGIKIYFYSAIALTPKLRTFFNFIQNNLLSILSDLTLLNKTISIEVFQEKLIIQWLKIEMEHIDWEVVLNYNSILSSNTYENRNLPKNLIFDSTEGTFNFLNHTNKILPQLACSEFTYFTVDYKLNFISYNVINHNNRLRNMTYQFLPEFLVLFKNLNKWSFHKTTNNDMIITNGHEIILSKRKNKFTIYDSATFKNCIRNYLNCKYSTSCNLFELIFDLSYKRKGALLVYDPNDKISQYIINNDALIIENEPNLLKKSINQSINQIELDKYDVNVLKKDLIIELCSIDGALIFNDSKIKGYGAMIKAITISDIFMGARYIAAKSAQSYGFSVIQISSDGMINIFFSHDGKAQEISFL